MKGGTWQEAVKGYGISRDAFYKATRRVVDAINHCYGGSMLEFKEFDNPEELALLEEGFNRLTNGVVRGCVGTFQPRFHAHLIHSWLFHPKVPLMALLFAFGAPPRNAMRVLTLGRTTTGRDTSV